jgi:hypothetical protein
MIPRFDIAHGTNNGSAFIFQSPRPMGNQREHSRVCHDISLHANVGLAFVTMSTANYFATCALHSSPKRPDSFPAVFNIIWTASM